jgi:hypothetical protein
MLLILCKCIDDNASNVIVDSAFAKYVDAFIESGRSRGRDIDFSDTGLDIRFGEVNQNAGAECFELGNSADGSHRIRISEPYWNEIDELAREVMIFHELGHCELERIHDNQLFSIGDWKSIMRGYPIPNKDPAINFHASRKKYYLDELFNPSLEFPEWIQLAPEYDEESGNEGLVFEFINEVKIDTNSLIRLDNFLFDLSINTHANNGILNVRFGETEKSNAYHFSIDIVTKKDIIFSAENIGALNVLDIDSVLKSNSVNIFRIRKNNDRIDVFLNGQFLYWLDGNDLGLNFLQVYADQQNKKISLSGKLYNL